LVWFLIVAVVGLAAFIVSLVCTNSSAAKDLARGGVLTTARVLRVEDRAPDMHISYVAAGRRRTRTVEISDAEATRWQDALNERRRDASHLYGSSGFTAPPDVAIRVRVPEADPGAGRPLLDEAPRDVHFAADAPGVVRGDVSQVTTRHRVVFIGIDGTAPPVTYTTTVGPRVDPRPGATFDIVYLPPDPTWNVTGPRGSLFPSPLQRYGIPGAVGLVLVAAVGWPMERRRRRHRRLLETGVERPVRILATGVSPTHGVLHGFLTLLQLATLVFGGRAAGSTGTPAVRRRFALRDGDETREFTRTAPAHLQIPSEPGAHTSVVCAPGEAREPVFVAELLARMAVQPAPTPAPGAS